MDLGPFLSTSVYVRAICLRNNFYQTIDTIVFVIQGIRRGISHDRVTSDTHGETVSEIQSVNHEKRRYVPW